MNSLNLSSMSLYQLYRLHTDVGWELFTRLWYVPIPIAVFGIIIKFKVIRKEIKKWIKL